MKLEDDIFEMKVGLHCDFPFFFFFFKKEC